MRHLRTSLFGLVVWLLPMAANAAVCFIPVDDPLWLGRHDQANVTLNTRIDKAGANITDQSRRNTEAILSAIRVLVKQEQVDGERQATVARKSQEASASVYVEQNKREAILAAQERFGPRGQSVDPCGSAQMLGTSLDAIENIGKGAAELMKSSSLDAAPGRAQDVDTVIKARITSYSPTHVNVESLLSGGEEEAGRFLSHAAGLPLRKTVKTDTAIEARLRLIAARRAEALRSPALMSLAAVRAANQGHGHAGDGGSAMEALNGLIDLYGGGQKHESWQKELATKHERGLLQEFTKLRAVALRLQKVNSDIDSRIASVMAVLLAGETSQNKFAASE